MLRRYVAGFIAMRYVLAEFALTALILILAYINGKLFLDPIKYAIIVCVVGVVIILLMYTRDRLHTNKQLNAIKKQGEYKHSIVLGYVFFLENRLVAYANGNLVEDDYSGITDATQLIGKKGKRAVNLKINGEEYQSQVSTPQQAERLAAFLKKKNPNIVLHDLKTKGPGTWKSIDLVPAERTMLGD